MTRINLVPVTELCNQHLIAEFREMPRLVGNLRQSLSRKKPFSMSEIPSQYVLGTGHVKFFYTKFKFLHKRHIEITNELLKRGFNLSMTDSSIFTTVKPEFFGDYTPTSEEIELNRRRIADRMPKNPKWEI